MIRCQKKQNKQTNKKQQQQQQDIKRSVTGCGYNHKMKYQTQVFCSPCPIVHQNKTYFIKQDTRKFKLKIKKKNSHSN